MILSNSLMLIKYGGCFFREVNRVVVTQNLCDELGHMNIQYYYSALSDGMFRVMDIIGMPKEEIPTRCTSLALHKEEAEFFDEVNEGDEFFMATALEHIGNKSIIFQHCFFCASDRRLLFRSKFVSVLMDLNTRVGIPIPKKFKEALLKEIPEYIADR